MKTLPLQGTAGRFATSYDLEKFATRLHSPFFTRFPIEGSFSSKVEGLKEGADAYLTKPFDKEELQVRLKKLIELRRHLQERYDGEARTARFLKPGIASVYPRDDGLLQQIQETLVAHFDEQDCKL